MSKRVVIEVFGLRDTAPAAGCACEDDCGPDCGTGPTMGESYRELVDYFQKSDLQGQVELKFVDILEDDLTNYEYARQRLERGCVMPLTAINGKMRFYGPVAPALVYEQAKKSADAFVFEMK